MDFDDDDLRRFDAYHKSLEREERCGPCKKDYEYTRMNHSLGIDMLPEESDYEYGSPLDFG